MKDDLGQVALAGARAARVLIVEKLSAAWQNAADTGRT